MKREKISIIDNPGDMKKFCAKENKVFGCECSYGCRVACPLWRAMQVQYLVNEKGMTIGEAHKASIREPLSQPEAIDAIRSAVLDNPSVSLRALLDIIERGHETR